MPQSEGAFQAPKPHQLPHLSANPSTLSLRTSIRSYPFYRVLVVEVVEEHSFEVDSDCVFVPHRQLHGLIAIDDAQLLRGRSASMHLPGPLPYNHQKKAPKKHPGVGFPY